MCVWEWVTFGGGYQAVVRCPGEITRRTRRLLKINRDYTREFERSVRPETNVGQLEDVLNVLCLATMFGLG